uniref:Uncharacterized protein n=1 Tax=Anguilla anguilla TaxID=7936 RepID=A0A0E9PQ12_ANGAN
MAHFNCFSVGPKLAYPCPLFRYFIDLSGTISE